MSVVPQLRHTSTEMSLRRVPKVIGPAGQIGHWTGSMGPSVGTISGPDAGDAEKSMGYRHKLGVQRQPGELGGGIRRTPCCATSCSFRGVNGPSALTRAEVLGRSRRARSRRSGSRRPSQCERRHEPDHAGSRDTRWGSGLDGDCDDPDPGGLLTSGRKHDMAATAEPSGETVTRLGGRDRARGGC